MNISDAFIDLMKALSAAFVEVSVFKLSVLTSKTSDKSLIILLFSSVTNLFKALAAENQLKSFRFYSFISIENKEFIFNFDEIIITHFFLMILKNKNFIHSVL